jgi:hypothetical protein
MMKLKKKVLNFEYPSGRGLLAIVVNRAGCDIVEPSTGLEAVDQAHSCCRVEDWRGVS